MLQISIPISYVVWMWQYCQEKSKIDCSQVDLGILACLISIDQNVRMRPDMAAATINSKRSHSAYFFPRGCQRIWMVE